MNFEEMIQKTVQEEENSIRPQSLSTYNSYLHSYEELLKKIKCSPEPFPLNEKKMRGFIYYITNVKLKPASLNTVQLYIASFAHWFRSQGLPDETKNIGFQKYIKSIVLIKTKNPPNRKAPITPNILEKMVNHTNSNLKDIQFMTATSLMYHGFLRIGELLNLKRKDIKLENNGILLTILISKTDPEGFSDHCFISKTETTYSAFGLKNI